MECWLILVSENSVNRLTKWDKEQDALQYLANVVAGGHPGVTPPKHSRCGCCRRYDNGFRNVPDWPERIHARFQDQNGMKKITDPTYQASAQAGAYFI